MPTEREFLANLCAGDEAAFARLVRDEGPAMLAVTRRLLRNEDDARDALQDAFLQVFRAVGKFRGDSSLTTWLHRIAWNAALMRLRRPATRFEVSIEEHLPKFDETGHHVDPMRPLPVPPDDELLGRELRARVRACVNRLPESARAVLVLRDLEEMNTAEVAEALGITETAVRVRLHRARLALHSILRREFGEEGASERGGG